MTLDGELIVRAHWNGVQVTAVDVASTRPQAGRVLAGRPIAEAIEIVPRLFSICGRSQGAAAQLACDAARAHIDDASLRQHESAVRSEAVQEIVRRMLLDWPRLVGAQPDDAALADVRRALASDRSDAMCAIVKERILGAANSWAVLDQADSGDHWLASAATPVAALITTLAKRSTVIASNIELLPDGERVASAIGAALASDSVFEREPTWQGMPAETGALARMRSRPWVAALVARSGRSVLARLVARVVELVALVQPNATLARAAGAVSIAPGTGLGWVETTRGLLLHAVHISKGIVQRYRIVAPTEWNFHPRGALAAGLIGVGARSEDELRRLMHPAVESLDPCVAYRVEISRS